MFGNIVAVHRCGDALLSESTVHLFSPQPHQHTFEYDEQALAAGIDDTGLFQHVQHIRSLGENFFTYDQNFLKELLRILRLFRNGGRLFGDDADDGQHSALFGLADGLVGNLDA